MVRRSTWLMFGVFLLVTAVAIFLVRSPSSTLTSTSQTPSPTEVPRLIVDLVQDQVVSLSLTRADNDTITLVRGADGAWTNPALGLSVDPAITEQLFSELLATRVLTQLSADYSLGALQLTNPEQSLTLTTADGTENRLDIGALTPIGNGYYVKYGANLPVVVSKYALEAVYGLFDQANTPSAPTYESTQTPENAP